MPAIQNDCLHMHIYIYISLSLSLCLFCAANRRSRHRAISRNAAQRAKEAKREPKRAKRDLTLSQKGAKWKPKESPNQPRNLQRHPCGTGSQTYRKGVPKGCPRRWLSEAIWVPRSRTNHEDTIPKNTQKHSQGNMKRDDKTMQTWSQK